MLYCAENGTKFNGKSHEKLCRGIHIYCLCTGGAYYVTYIFRFISNKSWDGGEGGGLSLNRPIVRRGEVTRGWLILLNQPLGRLSN
jgi:hypothetical protein